MEGVDREVLLREAVERHAQAVYNLCLCVLRNPADAEDASQEAFTALARDAGRIRDPGSLRPWLLKTALRACWKSSARSRRRTRVEREVRPMRDGGGGEGVLTGVREAVETLPEAERLPLMLRYYQGLEYAEIAEVLGCPEGSVSLRLRESLEGLRRILPAGLIAMTAADLEGALAAVPQRPVPAGLAASLGRIVAASAGAGAVTTIGGLIVANTKIYAAGATLLVLGMAGEAWRRDHAGLSERLRESQASRAPLERRIRDLEADLAASRARQASREKAVSAAPTAGTVSAPVAEVQAGPGVEALAAKVRAALKTQDAQALSDALLALLDLGEPAFPALISLMQEVNLIRETGDPYLLEWLEAPENKSVAWKIYLGMMMRSEKLGALADAVLGRECDPDRATLTALFLLQKGAQSQLPVARQSSLLLGVIRKAAVQESLDMILCQAGEQFGRLKPKASLPDIEKLALETSNPRARRILLGAIGGIGGPEAVVSLRRMLEAGPDARSQVIDALCSIQDPAANALLWELADRGSDASNRHWLLGNLASREENRARVVQQLRDPHLSGSDRWALLNGLAGGAQSDKDRQVLWNLYESEPVLRDDLLQILAEAYDPKATRILFQRLQTGQITERLSTVFPRMLDVKAIQENALPLKILIANTATPLEVRLNGFCGLYQADRKEALDALMTGFPQLPDSDRLRVVESIANRERRAERRAVLESIAASDPAESVRQMAARALAR